MLNRLIGFSPFDRIGFKVNAINESLSGFGIGGKHKRAVAKENWRPIASSLQGDSRNLRIAPGDLDFAILQHT
jgi:hypothetical protein